MKGREINIGILLRESSCLSSDKGLREVLHHKSLSCSTEQKPQRLLHSSLCAENFNFHIRQKKKPFRRHHVGCKIKYVQGMWAGAAAIRSFEMAISKVQLECPNESPGVHRSSRRSVILRSYSKGAQEPMVPDRSSRACLNNQRS